MSEGKEAGEIGGGEAVTSEEAGELFKFAWIKRDFERARHWAARGADVKSILGKADPALGDSDPLCQAIERDDWETARLLEFRVRERSGLDGKTPLMLCAEKTYNREAIALGARLLELSAPLWWTDDGGLDALTDAARRGNDEFARMILKAAKERDDMDSARLGKALREGASLRIMFTAKMAYALLEAGADPDEPGSGKRKLSARQVIEEHDEPRRSELMGALTAFDQRAQLGDQTSEASVAASRSGPRL